MLKLKLTRFAPGRKKRVAVDGEDEDRIRAFKPARSPRVHPASGAASRRRHAALAAVVLALMLVAAVEYRGQRWQHHLAALLAPPAQQTEQAFTQPSVVRSGNSTATAFSVVPLPHTSSVRLDACSSAAAAAAEHARKQTIQLIASEVYVPLASQPGPAWCRSDYPEGSPLPRLRRVALMRSAKPPSAGGDGVTLVTQLSLERVRSLERQCRAWPQPLAAVVYIPLLLGRVASADDARLNGTALDAALVPLLKLHAAMEAAADSACALDLEIVTEAHCDVVSVSLYPTNAARNRALRLASTELLVLVDADFLVSASLLAGMADPDDRRALLSDLQPPVAVVLPAFELAGRAQARAELAVRVAHAGKAALLNQLDAGTLRPFHAGHISMGHHATNYKRWFGATAPYEITFEGGFEPYMLTHRRHVPWYDERFRGYFMNKVAHAAHMNSLGARWVVHPDAFVVHLPHRPTNGKQLAGALDLNSLHNRMFTKAQKQMRRGQYRPYVSTPQLCYSSMLWDGMEGAV